MIEAELEQKIIDKIKSILPDEIQVVGSYDVHELKGIMLSGKTGNVIVKVSPRAYQSPTLPECTLECGISMSIRADIDYNGQNYKNLMSVIISQLEKWQKCDNDAHIDFSLTNFSVTGFLLDQGTTSLDTSAVTFNYTHNFTVYGIIS